MKKEYAGISFGKFIMAIIVVGIHTQPFFYYNQTVREIFNKLSLIAVPYFFLASGYLLDKKSCSMEINLDRIVYDTIIKYIKLYLIWSIIYLPLAIYYYKINHYTICFSIMVYFKNLLFVGEHYNSWVLWYLLSSIYSFIIIFFIVKFKYSSKNLFILALITFIITICIDMLFNNEMLQNFSQIKRIIEVTIGNSRILSGGFWIPLGILLSKYDFKMKIFKQTAILILGIAMMSLSSNIITKLGLILTSLIVFLFFSYINKFTKRTSTYFRVLSSNIYFIHLYIWTFYYICNYGEKYYGMDCFVFTVFISIIISIIYNRFKMYHNNLKLL